MSLRWERNYQAQRRAGDSVQDSGQLVLSFQRYDNDYAEGASSVILGSYGRNRVYHNASVKQPDGRHQIVVDHIVDHGGWKASLSRDIMGTETQQVFESSDEAQYWIERSCRTWLARVSKRKIER